jgi:hypothetical protein
MYILSKGTRDFIPTSQRDQDSPITFQITPPTRKVVLQGQAMMQKAILKSGVQLPTSTEDTLDIEAIGLDSIIDHQSEYNDLMLDACVVGWKNVVDEDGNEIPFSKEVFKSFNDTLIIQELLAEIQEIKTLPEKK